MRRVTHKIRDDRRCGTFVRHDKLRRTQEVRDARESQTWQEECYMRSQRDRGSVTAEVRDNRVSVTHEGRDAMGNMTHEVRGKSSYVTVEVRGAGGMLQMKSEVPEGLLYTNL